MKSLRLILSVCALLFAFTAIAQAQIAGEWEVSITSPQGTNANKAVFTQDGDKVSGVFKGERGELPIKVALTGQDIQINFSVKFQEMDLPITLKGKVNGAEMKGTADFGGFAEGEWSAKRATAGAAAPAAAPAASASAGAANITGDWAGEVETAQGSGNPAFTFKQEGEKLTGQYKGMLGEAPVNGTVKGNDVDFVIETSQGKVVYKGKIDGNKMSGTVTLGDIGSGTWKATKK